jgi:2-keto-4-pentenoate hydratase
VSPARPWDDPRVASGFRAQLARREERLGAGEAQLGWKVGFGSPESLERLRLAAPLVGFLLRETLVDPGGTVSVAGWTKPVAEPEIAVWLDRDLPGGSGREGVRAAIGALGPALELADVTFAPDDVERILAENIYARAVALGPPNAAGAGGGVHGLRPRLLLDGREVAVTDDPQALTGELVAVVGQVADLLEAFGLRLAAGDVVIAGSVVPPLALREGGRLRFELGVLGDLELEIEA